MLVTLHSSLQLVLSETIRIGDTEYKIQCSISYKRQKHHNCPIHHLQCFELCIEMWKPKDSHPTESSNYTKLHNICALHDLELQNDDLFKWASASTHSHQFLNNIIDGWNKMHTNYTRSHSFEEFGNDVSCSQAIGFCERISYILLHHKYCVQMCNIQWIQCLSESSMSDIILTAIIL